MTIKRANKLIFSLAAVLSLFVSAVSACACSHHQPQAKAEQPPCHFGAHGQPAAEEAPESDDGKSLGSGCGCFVKTPVPAITAKSDSKKAAVEKNVAAEDVSAFDHSRVQFVPSAPELPEAYFTPFAGRNLPTGPSRAPPRL